MASVRKEGIKDTVASNGGAMPSDKFKEKEVTLIICKVLKRGSCEPLSPAMGGPWPVLETSVLKQE